MSNQSQFALLKKRYFLPMFLTQALGAFNDNIYKNSLMALLTFVAASQIAIDNNILMNIAAGLFILPFFLFSATAGQIADKYDKAALIRKVKLAEIIIMSGASVALLTESYYVLLLILFLMGTQSSFFGPAKYSILPQHLHKDELVGGNALVEMGTFLAILAGTIMGGLLVSLENPTLWISISVVFFATLGYLTCRQIPAAPAPNPEIQVGYNPFKETAKTFRKVKANQPVFLSIMAISWFWFFGASYLTQIPNFTKTVLNADNQVMTILLTLFSIGVATGSLLCERLSGKKVELGIVPIGSIGLSVFSIDLFFSIPTVTSTELLDAAGFLALPGITRFLIDLACIGIFGGFFIVPLYAYIQQKADPKERAQTIAANNIMNSAFMVVNAISGALMLGVAGLTIPEYFLVVGIMNIVVALYVYSQVPEFLLRFVIWVLSHTMYRVSHEGLDHIPDEGPAVLVCNHVSYADSLLLGGACRRPVRFVMDKNIYNNPGLNWFFKAAKTIPITSQKKDPELYQAAMDQISEELKDGNVVCIFPEGKLTNDGEVDTFRRGIESIISRDPVQVIPMALQGLWGSVFSHKDGHALTTRPKRFWSKVNIIATKPWAPENATAEALEAEVKQIRGELA